MPKEHPVLIIITNLITSWLGRLMNESLVWIKPAMADSDRTYSSIADCDSFNHNQMQLHFKSRLNILFLFLTWFSSFLHHPRFSITSFNYAIKYLSE